MPTQERIKELDRELDRLYEDQRKADEQHRKDLDEWKKSGDHQKGRQKNKEYVDGCNERGKRWERIWDELVS